jgi:predicted nucleic acid-binding protein
VNAIVFKHVPVAQLPPERRAKPAKLPAATVTVRIEEEAQDGAEEAHTDNPLFRMWRDREDMADVASDVRGIRADRFSDSLALSHDMRLADALIGATAIEIKATLVTANVKHFSAINGLTIEAFAP